MRSFYWLVLTALLVALPGCTYSKTPKWMKGDWIFDVEASQKAGSEITQLPNGRPVSKEELAQLDATFSRLASVEIGITDDEIAALSGGNRKTKHFTVVRTVPDQECLIKRDDGALETFYKSGDEIYTYPDAGGKVKFYFKRKS